MKITRKVREQAALICAVLSAEMNQRGVVITNSQWARSSLGASHAAQRLAQRAFQHTYFYCAAPMAVADAEAESLLRTGWSPL